MHFYVEERGRETESEEYRGKMRQSNVHLLAMRPEFLTGEAPGPVFYAALAPAQFLGQKDSKFSE